MRSGGSSRVSVTDIFLTTHVMIGCENAESLRFWFFVPYLSEIPLSSCISRLEFFSCWLVL